MGIIHPLDTFLFKLLISFLLLEMPTQALGNFSVIGPREPVQTSVGGQAELSCHLFPPQSAQNMEVFWFKSQKVVHLYQNGEDRFKDQEPNYQGRTELVKDVITAGSVKLRIWDVKPSDAGQYKCLFNDYSHSAEAFVELKVIEIPTLFQTYPVWWSVIGILALVHFNILLYYIWKTYQYRDKFLVKQAYKVGVVFLAVLWVLSVLFLFHYSVNMSGCRGLDDLDDWVQNDHMYLAMMTFLPLLPTLLYVTVDCYYKSKERGNAAQDQPKDHTETTPLDRQ